MTKSITIFNPTPVLRPTVPDVQSLLPQFTHEQVPMVFIANSRYDARRFCYSEPHTLLGQQGYFVDIGWRLGYFPSTWQGDNRSLFFQDLQMLIHLAQTRTRQVNDVDHAQLGYWSKPWLIGGTDPDCIMQLQKMLGVTDV